MCLLSMKQILVSMFCRISLLIFEFVFQCGVEVPRTRSRTARQAEAEQA